ncbi:MAG TPA: DNA mismatch repair endonuclease MutL [Chloroflexota bacterium]|nr:DNA mismatch repair endonuclease MutL [Chloroflexota bacterium]
MTTHRPIAILPPAVAERIGAGEVVERPASVVRELLDNATDAGADEVTVEVRGGGLELIRVTDDGRGIPPDEVELAFRHHATSKIASLDDLLNLQTLGFRGEALPSIAAVAEVELLTSDDAHDSGTVVALRAGEIVRRRRTARQRGTTVTVRRLFYNVPARLKFLTTGRGETLAVGQLVRRYALANPALRLSLLLEGRLSFRSSGSGRLATAMADVYGATVADTLLSLPTRQIEGTTIGGLIGSRGVTRSSRDQVTLIVNGRCAACRSILLAVEAAYRPFLPRGRHPIAAIVVEVPPGELDPNVHPAKTEVRLLREPAVAAAIAEEVREIMGHAPVRPPADADFSLGAGQYRLPLSRRRLAEAPGPRWPPTPDEQQVLDSTLPTMRVLGQVDGSLILAEAEPGLFLIDQHRAHERIIYEELVRRAGQGAMEAQALLEPVVLELKPHQAALLEERLTDLDALGFRCERIGRRAYLVRAVPAVPGRESFTANLDALLEDATSDADGWRGRLMTALACRSAIRRNHPLSELDMEELVRGLASTAAPAVCPHGSPLILHLGRDFLRKQFGW